MKKVGRFWLPDSDSYFCKFLGNNEEGFQLDRLKEALTFVGDFDVAIDGGAHIGSWSRYMTSLFNTVLAFEPALDTYQCLQKNVVDTDNIVLYNSALGDKDGRVESVDDVTREGNTGARFVKPSAYGSVAMVSIDSLNLSNLSFLKLDIEGAEILALEGAERTLRKYRPVVYIEAKKGMAERFGRKTKASLDYMVSLGAEQVAKFGSDRVFVFK